MCNSAVNRANRVALVQAPLRGAPHAAIPPNCSGHDPFDNGRPAQGGTATPKRDGRVSGAQGQSSKRDGRTGGAHARRSGGQNTPAGQGASGGQDGPVPAGFGPRKPQRLQYQAPSIDGGAHVETTTGPGVADDFARVGRNDPCPCGSGRKYKRCHGDPRTRPDA